MTPAAATRIAAIDFVRGVAVLGILAINITGFWGPTLASFSPRLPHPDPGADAWFAFAFVVFEGKMRALFTLLFGASMVLFADAAERRGASADWAQARRLLWLALFGYLHYLLLWWGDILFPYALCGLMALALRRMAPAGLVIAGLALFLVPHALDAAGDVIGIATEQSVLAGHGAAADVADQAAMMQRIAASLADDTRILNAGFLAALRLRLSTAPFLPFETFLHTLTETLPLMLLGMAMLRTGFFTGRWSHAALRRTAAIGIGAGGLMALGLIGWAGSHGFPPRAMLVLGGALAAPEHLLMAIGYAALLVLLWPRLRDGAAARMLAAAGRCAFTNYLGTTVLMAAIFSGWGLGLGPEMPRALLPLFVLLGWAAMLAWPRWWLARHPSGPLETLWRNLTWLGFRSPRPPASSV
jgi:uncharacterized protein